MKTFILRLKNNRGDAEPLFFIWGMLIVILLLWFSMDLINITWSRYTVKREAQTISRLYAVNWVDGVWNPDCKEATMSSCQYNTLGESKLAQDMKKIVDSAISNGKFSNFRLVISTNPDNGIENCGTAVMCVVSDGKETVVSGWGPSLTKNNLDYGTDLYMWVSATAPYRYIGEKLGLSDPEYKVINKFASERFSKNDQGVDG